MSSQVSGLVHLIRTLLGADLKGSGPTPTPDTALFPYVTVTKISGLDYESLSGDTGLEATIMQISVWDKSYDSADHIRRRIKPYLKSGSVVGKLVPGLTDVAIASVNHAGDKELYDADLKLHQAISRFKINWDTLTIGDFMGRIQGSIGSDVVPDANGLLTLGDANTFTVRIPAGNPHMKGISVANWQAGSYIRLIWNVTGSPGYCTIDGAAVVPTGYAPFAAGDVPGPNTPHIYQYINNAWEVIL